ncbi:lysozyme [Volucribacter psittacicida]|uniref:Lysozyme n=1 Tax=Volucribacter psittacicida TaxID=203482 RepID=A0A4R1FNN4_9PAST|nr:lysozyme [Volucribacter psittacicida]TCJ96163.1 lysozyme [Volucribacter psittacicida]
MKINQKKISAVICSVGAVIGLVSMYYADELRITERGLAIIGNAEGCRQTPYYCPAGILTVGIGTAETSGEKIEQGKVYSLDDIAQAWVKQLKVAEKCVNRFGNGRNMPLGAFEAMVSLTFNTGCGKMQSSTLFRMANQGYTPAMCNQFERWVYSGGKKLNGLVKRRQQEKALCLAD